MIATPFTTDALAVAAVLAEGGVAIVPTDTVYGIAASLRHQDAIRRIFDIKQRPVNRPIPVLVSSTEACRTYGSEISHTTRRLIDRFWPGPLTVVVPATPDVPEACLAGGKTVGLRMPDHPDLLKLIEASGGALAVTSANRSGEPETTSARAAHESLRDLVDIVLDTGSTLGTKPSTVVDASGPNPGIIRNGAIAESCILSFLSGS